MSGAARSTRISQLVLSQRGDRLLALCSDRVLRLYTVDPAAARKSPRVSPEAACALLSAAQVSNRSNKCGITPLSQLLHGSEVC